jgi:hypothetical protein
MSLTSVLGNPTYAFQYPEAFNVVETLVVRQLVAVDDELSIAQDLQIGATANVNIEAKGKVQMYTLPSGTVDFYTALTTNGVRTNTKYLEISALASGHAQIATTSAQVLDVRGGDTLATTMVSHTTLTKGGDGSNQFLTLPQGEQFYFGNDVNIEHGLIVSGNAVISENLLVNNNLITYGNIFSSNINLWRNVDSNLVENNNISQVGYGFRVNNSHQLELVKYSKFENTTVAKKVALFGQAKYNSNMNSDDGCVYTSINEILGQTNLPDMPASSGSVDLTQPINAYWSHASTGINYSSGFVGVGTSTPVCALDIVGDIRGQKISASNVSASNADIGTLSTDVAVIRQTTSSSDLRLKNVLAQKSPLECLEHINLLSVTTFAFKSDDSQKAIDGLIAQEVESILPNAIEQKNFMGLADCKTIDYNQIIANLIGAVQYLSDKLSL